MLHRPRHRRFGQPHQPIPLRLNQRRLDLRRRRQRGEKHSQVGISPTGELPGMARGSSPEAGRRRPRGRELGPPRAESSHVAELGKVAARERLGSCRRVMDPDLLNRLWRVIIVKGRSKIL